MAEAKQYIGSLISLVSKSDIRYEGILHTIDVDQSTISLKNVKSMGTEGRKRTGPQIPANPEAYEYIIFKGTDIKELQVLQGDEPSLQEQDQAVLHAEQAAPPRQSAWNQQAGLGDGLRQQGGLGLDQGNRDSGMNHSPLGLQGDQRVFGNQRRDVRPHDSSMMNKPQQAPEPAPAWGQAGDGAARFGGGGRGQGGGRGRGRRPEPLPAWARDDDVGRPGGMPNGQPAGAPQRMGRGGYAGGVRQMVPPSVQGGQQSRQMPGGGQANGGSAWGGQKPTSYALAAGGTGSAGGAGRGMAPPPRARGRGMPGRGRVPVAGGRGGGRSVASAPAVTVPNEDFDFESGHQKFNKDEMAKEIVTAEKTEQHVYDPDDFFDTISSDIKEKSQVPPRPHKDDIRAKFAEQRKIDVETFGQTAMHMNVHLSFRGRGRGGPGARGTGGRYSGRYSGRGGRQQYAGNAGYQRYNGRGRGGGAGGGGGDRS